MTGAGVSPVRLGLAAVGVVGAASALGLALLPGSTDDPSRPLEFAGEFDRASPLTLATLEIDSGRWVIDYSFVGRYSAGIGSSSTLTCRITERSSGITIDPQQPVVVSANGSWEAFSSETAVALPAMQLALRCVTRPGVVGLTSFTDVVFEARSIPD